MNYITDIPLKELPAVVKSVGLKAYAAGQIVSWLYKKRVSSFGEMTDLSKGVRDELEKRYKLNPLRIVDVKKAVDGTKKYLFELRDGHNVECVYIPAEDERNTVCVSTQAGCQMGCSFCRTAELGFKRDLTQGEILGQLIAVMREIPKPVTNIVLMGMGEPLQNFEAVSNAVSIMLDAKAFGLSKRRVTLSTCGIIKSLAEFVKNFDIKIAISLNATTDELRSKLMPVNKKYPISEIIKFCREYTKTARFRVTFEYILMKGVNDTDEDMKRLVALMKGIKGKINLIPFNPFEGAPFKAPDKETVEKWNEYLASKEIQVNVRASRGSEIMAACGQLAGLH